MRILFPGIFLFCALGVCGQDSLAQRLKVYLIPGQGSDHRVYGKLKLDSIYDTVRVHYLQPVKGETMNAYARRLAAQVDTTQPFALVGLSLGGMLATEMSCFLKPEKTIIVSSAASRAELPGRYKFMKAVPLYRVFPPGLIKAGAFVAQPVVEPDRRKEKETFKAMLRAKDKLFLKRSVHCIVRWEGPKDSLNCPLVHIHGDNDHTLPLRKVKADVVVKGGSHMMLLTRAEELSALINAALKE